MLYLLPLNDGFTKLCCHYFVFKGRVRLGWIHEFRQNFAVTGSSITVFCRMTDAIAIHGHDIIDLVSAHPDGIRLSQLMEMVGGIV